MSHCYRGRDPFNQNSNRPDREKWSTSKGGPVFSKLFRLDRTDPLSFGPKFLEILVEWIAPTMTLHSPCVIKVNFMFLQTHIYKTSSLNASTNENTSSILAIKRVNSILTDHFRRKNMADEVFFLFSEPFVHFTSV